MNTQINEDLIGKKIQEIRTQKGLSQEQLQNLSGIKNTVISAIENGKRTIGLHTIAAIARSLEVSIDELCFGSDAFPYEKLPSDQGTIIVNNIVQLLENGIIDGISKTEDYSYYYFRIGKYKREIDRLINTLYHINENINYYEDIDSCINVIKKSVIEEINETISIDNYLKNIQSQKNDN